MNSPKTHLLICGTSTRAAAASAAAAGFAVTTIDGYADRDQHPGVRALSMPRDFRRPFTARAAARASRTIDCDAVAYLSSFENHPRAVRALAHGRALWGNAPEVLARVRNPVLVADALRSRGFAGPVVRYGNAIDLGRGDGWMVKPIRSGGGRRVRPWQGGERVPRDCYLQERIDGVAGSVVFVAAGGEAVTLGVSRQLIGEAAFGADGHRYCGSILDADPAESREGAAMTQHACALARAAAAEFGLIGVNGIDFVVANGIPYPIEINPRWSSSMELVERLYGVSVLGAHAAACEQRVLPRGESIGATRGIGSVGKAIVFARHDVIAGETSRWVDDDEVRDVPHPGEHIRKGDPVCTVLAAASEARSCYDALIQQAGRVHAELETWTVL